MDKNETLINNNEILDSTICYTDKLSIMSNNNRRYDIKIIKQYINILEYNNKIIQMGKIYKISSCRFKNAKKSKILYIKSIEMGSDLQIKICGVHQYHSFSDFGAIYEKVDNKARRKSLKKWYKTNTPPPNNFRILQIPIMPGTIESFSVQSLFQLDIKEHNPEYIKTPLTEQRSHEENYKFILWLINHKLDQYKREGEDMFTKFENKNKQFFIRV